MSKLARLFRILIVAVVALAAGVLSARYLSRPAGPEHALQLDSPRPLPSFTLRDHSGGVFDRASMEGHWTLIFFGFTHCPDVCPTTLHTLAGVLGALADLPSGSQPGVVMVSIDPIRDTPEKLAAYVPFFDPDFVGVTGDMADIMTLTRNLGVAFSYGPVDGSDAYSVDHTASIFLVDPEARLAAVFGTPHAVADIARDYQRIVEDAS